MCLNACGYDKYRHLWWKILVVQYYQINTRCHGQLYLSSYDCKYFCIVLFSWRKVSKILYRSGLQTRSLWVRHESQTMTPVETNECTSVNFFQVTASCFKELCSLNAIYLFKILAQGAIQVLHNAMVTGVYKIISKWVMVKYFYLPGRALLCLYFLSKETVDKLTSILVNIKFM